jgi:hypothetical protein
MDKVTKSVNETPAEDGYRKLFQTQKRGESLAALSARSGVARGTLSWWRYELRRRDRVRGGDGRAAAPALLPVRVVEPTWSARPGRTSYEVSLVDGRRVIRVPAGFDPGEVRALVAAVESVSC